MKIENYHLKSDPDLAVFEFVSVGTKGAVRKLIHFQATYTPGLYNLAFGDKDPITGEIDDLAVTNNGDTDKVLATVVAALRTFLDKNPDAFVYATGSTPARTRLYRMGITRFYEEVRDDLKIYGRIGKALSDFEPGTEYEGFLAQRKFQ